jgi:CheY-like chemotaxis protein
MELPPGLPAGVYALLTVADSGCGMDEATLEHIFDPFFTTKFTGRGLGLALVQGIIRDHAGAITVQSLVGRGTSFSVWLPALPAHADTPRTQVTAESWRGTGTVLVIDDEEALQAVYTRMLEQLGFQVLVASDGPAGLQLFREHASRLTCVVLDVTMPGMTGTVVAQEIRRLSPDLPLVLMSGYTREEVVSVLSGMLQIEFLPKPFSLSEMRDTLRQVLSHQQSRQRGSV